MSYSNGPQITTSGLLSYYDASNLKSYPGSGTSWKDLASSTSVSLSNLNAFASGSELNTKSVEFATIPFSFSANMTFDLWYRTYTTGSNTPNQFASPGIMQVGSYNTVSSFTLWDWSVSNPNNHSIYTFINNGATWTDVTNASQVFSDAQWLRFHHICMVFSGSSGWSNYKLYIDTRLETNYNIATPVTTIGGGNYVYLTGANGGATNNSYNSLKIYNRALSQEDILQNYNATKTRFGL